MASIAKRPDGKWRARYRDAGGKEHSRHFGKKVDAQRWLDEVTASIVTGQYVNPRDGRVTLASYATGWEAAQVCAPATARITDNALRLHILPVLGDRTLVSILRSDVQGLVKQLEEQLGPGSVRNVYDVLAKVMGAAVDDKKIAVSPCRRITLPKLAEAEVHPPAVAQVTAMAEAMPARYRAAVVLLAGSGLRIGELLGLRVRDVDFLRRTVRVERQRVQSGEIKPPKTQSSYRTVPVGQVVVDELAAHLREHPSGEWLFTREDGSPLTYRRWKVEWQSAWRAAGQPRVGDEPLTTHDLRHFFASAVIAGGASVKQVQAVLGHSSAVITLRVYSHLWPGDDDRTRSVMDAVLGVLRTRCGPSEPAADGTAGQAV